MRNIIKYGIFLVVTLSLLALNVLALSDPSDNSIKLANNSSQQSIKPVNNGEEPISIDMNINFEPYSHEQLRDYSDTIVIGTVKEILPPRWNTMDGNHPNKSLTELDYNDIIYTDIIISVDKYLKNPLSSGEVTVRITGGTIGNVSMSTDADPSFNTSEKVLLYLNRDDNPATKDISPEHFVVLDFHRGKYTLTDEGKAITTDETVTLDELLSTINQTGNPDVQQNKTNNTETSDNTGTAGKQEGFGSTIESRRIPVISFFWALAVVIGAVTILRHRQK